MQRVIVALSNGYQLRLLFHAGVIRHLQEEGCKIWVCSATMLSQETMKELGSDVNIVKQVIRPPNVIVRYYQLVKKFFLWPDKLSPAQLETKQNFARSFPVVFAIINLLDKAMDFEAKKSLHRQLMRNGNARTILNEIRPDIVLVCSPGFAYTDAALLNEASYSGIKTVAVGQSWDNFSTKGYSHPAPDLMLCWGEQMRREAIELQGYRPDKVKICGAPHFDTYHDLSRLGSKEALLREFQLDPNRKTIVYGTSPGIVSRNEFEVVRKLAELVNANPATSPLGEPSQLLIRLSPQELVGAYMTKDLCRYDDLEGPFVRISRPLVRSSALNMDLCAQDYLLLAKTLACADVVGNLASTFSLDGVAAGKPVFSVLYDEDSGLPQDQLTRRYTYYLHLQQMYATGGVRVAFNFADMLAILRDYIQHPEHDQVARQRLITEFLYKIDGQSAKRVAQEILALHELPSK